MASPTLDRTVTDNRVAVRTALVVLAVGRAVASGLVSAFGEAFMTANRPGEPLILPSWPGILHLERDHCDRIFSVGMATPPTRPRDS